MGLIDLSQPLFDGCPNCPAHPPVKIRTEAHSDGGPSSWQMEFFDFASHTGSHLDAPRHKMADGMTLSELPLETFCGAAVLADLRGILPETEIDGAMLAQAVKAEVRGRIVLLATGWGDLREANDLWLYQSPRLSPDGARWLVENGVRAVGIDHFSIGGAQEPGNADTHTVLLGNGLWVLEELKFPTEVFELEWPQQLMALPIHLVDGSGGPCRPVLVMV